MQYLPISSIRLPAPAVHVVVKPPLGTPDTRLTLGCGSPVAGGGDPPNADNNLLEFLN